MPKRSKAGARYYLVTDKRHPERTAMVEANRPGQAIAAATSDWFACEIATAHEVLAWHKAGKPFVVYNQAAQQVDIEEVTGKAPTAVENLDRIDEILAKANSDPPTAPSVVVDRINKILGNSVGTEPATAGAGSFEGAQSAGTGPATQTSKTAGSGTLTSPAPRKRLMASSVFGKLGQTNNDD